MSKIQEIQDKIEALEYAKSLLESELQPLLEQIRTIESKIKGLLEDKIVPLRNKLKIEQNKTTEAEQYPFLLARRTKMMANFFKNKGYQIVECMTEPKKDERAIAKQLWKCHDIILPLFKQLFNAQNEVVYPLEGFKPDDKNYILNFCKSLQNHRWITFEVAKKKDFVTLHHNEPQKHRMFYNGCWAEVVNRYIICKVLSEFGKKHKISFKMFQNIKLRNINSKRTAGHDMELDIVVDLGSRFYIFETKSGNYDRKKCRLRAEQLKSDNSRFILCRMKGTDDISSDSPYQKLALPKLEEQLNELLQKDFLDGNQSDNRAAATGQPNYPEKPDSSTEASEQALPKTNNNME